MREIDRVIEMICTQGCKSVNKVRQQIENGDTVMELSRLSRKERIVVKAELDAIMSVYENKKKVSSF